MRVISKAMRFVAGVLCARSLAATLVLAGASIAPSHAQYPERPITLIVGFAAGGGTDQAARLLALHLTESLGRPVVVENRTGGGGIVSINAVKRAPADGYTFLVCTSAFVVLPSLHEAPPHDPIKDFSAVVTLGASPNIMVARADSDVGSLADLLAKAKANPGKLNLASGGIGTTPHLAIELLKLRSKTEMVHVPYAGAAPGMQALLAGNIDVLAGLLGGSYIELIRSNKIRGLFVTGAERWPDLPNVPTLAEAGMPNSETTTFVGMWAPAGTPGEIVDKVAQASLQIFKRPDVAARMRSLGFGLVQEGPTELRQRVEREVPLYREIIEQAKLKIAK